MAGAVSMRQTVGDSRQHLARHLGTERKRLVQQATSALGQLGDCLSAVAHPLKPVACWTQALAAVAICRLGYGAKLWKGI